MMARRTGIVLTIAAAALAGACTVGQTKAPGLSGPSAFAWSFQLTASPDTLTQDGGSQAVVRVVATDPSGKPAGGESFRLDILACGGIADIGTLSARTVATTSDGSATAVYTVPASNVYCPNGASVDPVRVVATPISTNFDTAHTETASIHIVPLGIILPPGSAPTADFTFSPSAPSVGDDTVFDASASKAGAANSQIVSYDWDFGDGGTGSGKIRDHVFASARAYTVTLTVTNDLGLSASTSKSVSAGLPAKPVAKFVFAPTSPAPGTSVLFDATSSTAAQGHSIVSYSWTFVDPNSSSNTATGMTATHTFTAAGDYSVVLIVTDDAGQQAINDSTTITVGP
jgi:PKD repeat protein